MEAITTSGSTQVAPANSLRGEWARFGTFLFRPVLPERAPLPNGASLLAVLRLLVLDLAIMSILLAVGWTASALGVDLPETALAGMELNPQIILTAVIVAPLIEEIAFRSWLSGRSGHLLALICLAAGGGIGAAIFTGSLPGGAPAVWAPLIAGASAILAAILLYLLRRRGAMRWFARGFPALYWTSALLFASAHLLNFNGENLFALLPLVLPQFAIGTILGYARVNYGLWSSVLLHLLHNGAFIGLVLLASGAG